MRGAIDGRDKFHLPIWIFDPDNQSVHTYNNIIWKWKVFYEKHHGSTPKEAEGLDIWGRNVNGEGGQESAVARDGSAHVPHGDHCGGGLRLLVHTGNERNVNDRRG